MSSKSQFSTRMRCPECGSSNLLWDYNAGEMVCIGCGCVMDERLVDTRPEWKAFDWEEIVKRKRVGMPATYSIHDKGLSTITDWNDKKSIRGKLSPEQIIELRSLRKWQRRFRIFDDVERNLAFALHELNRVSSALNLPRNIVESASIIYRRTAKKGLIRGRSHHRMAVAAVYLVCRQYDIPMSMNEVASVSNVRKKEIAKSYRTIVKNLEVFIPSSNGCHLVAKLSNKLKLSGRTEMLAMRVFEIAKEMKLTNGRRPNSIASAANISTVLTNERRGQREIAEAADVTEVTLRNRYKELLEKILIT